MEMKFTWQTTIYIDEDEAREWHFNNTDDTYDNEEEYDAYEPTRDDYYGAAREALENDWCEYDLVDES